jgi:hypothetical protein
MCTTADRALQGSCPQLIGWPDFDAWASDAVEAARRRLSDTGKHGTC